MNILRLVLEVHIYCLTKMFFKIEDVPTKGFQHRRILCWVNDERLELNWYYSLVTTNDGLNEKLLRTAFIHDCPNLGLNLLPTYQLPNLGLTVLHHNHYTSQFCRSKVALSWYDQQEWISWDSEVHFIKSYNITI